MTGLHYPGRRSKSVLKSRAPKLAAVLLVALIVLPVTPASADHIGGPMILTGIDAEDCGANAHGPIGNWATLVQNGMLANTSNGGDGILVIGSSTPGVRAFWNFISVGIKEAVTFGNEKSSFTGYQMIAVVGSRSNTCGGLTAAQNTALTARAAEFAAFVNAGGGLFVSDQSDIPAAERFGFVGGPNSFETSPSSYSAIDPTPHGLAVGVNDSLDGPHWHTVFTKFPDFLQPLAYSAGTLNIAALGGGRVALPVTPGGPPAHPPPPPPSPSPGLLDGVFALVNPELPAPSPSPSPSPDPSPSADAPAMAETTPPTEGSTGAVPSGGVAAGGGGSTSGADGRTALIVLILLAAVAHVLVFTRRKAGARRQ